ncbi:protein halfway, putative [Pediculus humanus corporis]|uniref:Protein halfway, putative n=1 Tax=Pediculus humanus subsp. corporis TaxID=121224 RepID=E0VCV2_PEDHC|nr:protein halfway, putative [Pediculus humanus corporis]EEB11208.1 protein halfway, putative [Pediculus humanus corporis]
MYIWLIIFFQTLVLKSNQENVVGKVNQEKDVVVINPPLDVYNNNETLCFGVKEEACSLLQEKETCLCKTLNNDSVFCCHITNPYQLNNNLRCADNRGVECQTLMQYLTENPQTVFLNVDSTYCFSSKNFHWFNSIAQVPLSQVLILRNIQESCTKGCTCRSYRLDMVSGKHPTVSVLVDCSSLGLKKLPEYLPKNTISLNVSYNNITSLDPLTFDENYKDIREFYADYNQISSILALEGSKFIDNFLVLSLRENNIKSLPTYILSNTFDRNYHIRRVNLGGNRLVCNCSVAQVVKVWLLSNKKHIPDYDQLLCDNTGERVMALDQNKACMYQRDWTDYIYYMIAGEIGLLLLLVGKVSYDYWVFKTTGYLPWPASKMPKLPCDWVLE